MKNLCNKHVLLETRKHVVQTYVKSVMCYGCEVWTRNKRIQSQLEGGRKNVVSEEDDKGALDSKNVVSDEDDEGALDSKNVVSEEDDEGALDSKNVVSEEDDEGSLDSKNIK
jgi:hypothetical protein